MADTPSTPDRSQQVLVVVAKSDTTKILFKGAVGTSSAQITGLKPNAQVAAGDYQCAFQSSDGSVTSPFADVPAFTVPAANNQAGS